MSDYRDPNDPLFGNTVYEPAEQRGSTGWGWIAGAIFLVIILALAFGVGQESKRVASNDAAPPAASRTVPTTPPSAMKPALPAAPGLAPPAAPNSGAPNRP